MEYEETDSVLYNIQDYQDYTINTQNIFDGYYDAESGYYHFFISKHLTKILNGDIEDLSLYLNMVNKSFFPHRAIFQSSDNIELKVTYTKH